MKAITRDDTEHGEEYVLRREAEHAIAEAVKAERGRLRAALMAKHEAAKGKHNLYHCLAMEIFGECRMRSSGCAKRFAPTA